ncbi:signal recognition particle binding [Raphanus sativus]|nr:signal recognition particle binding [Raphanus sativus]
MAEEWLNRGIEYLQKIPPTQLYATVGVLLFTTILLLLSIRLDKHTKSNTVLLFGLSGNGKTVLFYQLLDGSSHQGTKGKIKHVHLVDVPGHSRLRPKLEERLGVPPKLSCSFRVTSNSSRSAVSAAEIANDFAIGSKEKCSPSRIAVRKSLSLKHLDSMEKLFRSKTSFENTSSPE